MHQWYVYEIFSTLLVGVNRVLTVIVLPNIDAYMAATGSQSRAVRPTVCDQTGIAGGVQSNGATVLGQTPGTPQAAFTAAQQLAAGTGNGIVNGGAVQGGATTPAQGQAGVAAPAPAQGQPGAVAPATPATPAAPATPAQGQAGNVGGVAGTAGTVAGAANPAAAATTAKAKGKNNNKNN